MNISNITKETFRKLFQNVAAEMETPVAEIQLCFYFPDSEWKLAAFKNLIYVKLIAFDDYIEKITLANFLDDVLLKTVGANKIKTIINKSGVMYAGELCCDAKEIRIFLSDNGDNFPKAVLLQKEKRIRRIDIEKEIIHL